MMLSEGDEVRVSEPLRLYDGEWFLPGERIWVLEVRGERLRVRCGRSGVDGWVDRTDVQALAT